MLTNYTVIRAQCNRISVIWKLKYPGCTEDDVTVQYSSSADSVRVITSTESQDVYANVFFHYTVNISAGNATDTIDLPGTSCCMQLLCVQFMTNGYSDHCI